MVERYICCGTQPTMVNSAAWPRVSRDGALALVNVLRAGGPSLGGSLSATELHLGRRMSSHGGVCCSSSAHRGSLQTVRLGCSNFAHRRFSRKVQTGCSNFSHRDVSQKVQMSCPNFSHNIPLGCSNFACGAVSQKAQMGCSHFAHRGVWRKAEISAGGDALGLGSSLATVVHSSLSLRRVKAGSKLENDREEAVSSPLEKEDKEKSVDKNEGLVESIEAELGRQFGGALWFSVLLLCLALFGGVYVFLIVNYADFSDIPIFRGPQR